MRLSAQTHQSRLAAPCHGAVVLVAALAAAALSGCVQRRMTIRSNPPGAMVYVDDEPIGITPCSHDFVYYGTRKVRLVKDGFETQTVLQPMPAPWYQFTPIDFVAENLVPWEIRDERYLDYQLQPQVIVPTDQLLGRAENLRASSRGAPAAAPVTAPNPSTP
jgi:hypothetical protein